MGMIHIHSRYIVQVLVYLDFGLVSSLLVQFAMVAKLATEMISLLAMSRTSKEKGTNATFLI